ncbi:MAG: hypothetical protein JXA33_03000 [Anaerolineae bacterium]|nr:hypothetical protein [Anaerolineae bacterium]
MGHSLSGHELKHSLHRFLYGVLSVSILFMPACALTPLPSYTPTPSPTFPLTITFPQAPTALCQVATQLQLRPRVTGAWPNANPVTWELTPHGDRQMLNQGTWSPETADLLITFPNGTPLPPGEYTVSFHADDRSPSVNIAQHTFSIMDTPIQLTGLTLALSPTGPNINYLPADTQHFYLRYTYQGICPGAPFWAVVRRGEETICKQTISLDSEQGTGVVACYRADGVALAEDTYQADLSLMGEAKLHLTFKVGQEPTPTPPTATATPLPSPTATSLPLTCEPSFIAAGLNADGTPYLPQERFEWYTQIVYVGSYCTGLTTGMSWEARWYRNGEPFTQTYGIWAGDTGGIVWDRLINTPKQPFLMPGTYTVSLTIAHTTSLTGTFYLIPYVRSTPSP